MLMLQVTYVTDKKGARHKAKLAECGECKNREFVIFFVEGQDHPHYQCTVCETSYCGTWDGSQCQTDA